MLQWFKAGTVNALYLSPLSSDVVIAHHSPSDIAQ